MHVSVFSRLFLFVSVCTIFFLTSAEKLQNKGSTTMTEPSLKVAATPKLAVVNVHRIITLDPKSLQTASDEWRALYNELQETLKPANKEIEELEGKFNKLRAELEEAQKKGVAEIEALQKSKIASDKTLREKGQALQAKLEEKYVNEVRPLEMRLRNQHMQREQFIQGALDDAQAKIGPKIEKIFEEIQASQGWDMILKGDAVLGKVNKRFDITDEVLTILNKRYAQEKTEQKSKMGDTKQKAAPQARDTKPHVAPAA